MKPTITFHDIVGLDLGPIKTLLRGNQHSDDTRTFSVRRLSLRDKDGDTYSIELYSEDAKALLTHYGKWTEAADSPSATEATK